MTEDLPPKEQPVDVAEARATQHLPKAGAAPYGLGPYGDEAEHVGPPEVIIFTPPYRPFFDTDARSVMITLLPQHYNLIPNPAFRTDTTGWEITGLTTELNADSWVGQSLACSGDGMLRYRQGAGKFIYVGPLKQTQENHWDFRRGGPEATYSVYAKGAGDVRLSMDAYLPVDSLDLDSGPQNQNLADYSESAIMRFGGTNLLTAAASSAEADTTFYKVLSNATMSIVSTNSFSGSKSLRVTAVAAGAVRVWFTEPRIPVVGGKTYSSVVCKWTAGAGASDISWSHVYYDVIGSGLGAVTGSTQNSAVSLVAPVRADTVGCIINFTASAAGDYVDFDGFGVWEGQGGEWTPPGHPDTVREKIEVGNLLTEKQAATSTVSGEWADYAGNATITATGDGRLLVNTPINKGSSAGVIGRNTPVTPGQTYTAGALLFASNQTPNVYATILWLDLYGRQIGSSPGTARPMPYPVAARVETTGVAPAGSAFGLLVFGVAASATSPTGYFIKEAGFWAGAGGTWSMPDPQYRVWKRIDPAPETAPFFENTGQGLAVAGVRGEWTTVEDDGEWHRLTLTTKARVSENEGQVSFVGARWIDGKIEIRNANDLKISAVMLDPTEYPLCDYFDGGMAEYPDLDDFLWEGVADNSVSYYYFDRVIRAKWLYEWMRFVIPVNRPFQIFFGSYWRPYVGATGETKMMAIPSDVLNYRRTPTSLYADPAGSPPVGSEDAG